MGRIRDFFKNFRQTTARQLAVAAVRREERNLVRRMRYWEAKQMPGIKAVDPREPVADMTTNQLKAYARRMHNMRGDAIKPAGISVPGGEMLPLDRYSEYAALWEAREKEKQDKLRQLKLKGIPQNPKLALIDVDPMTGQLKPERGGSYVLTLYGDVQVPKTKETLERRIEMMGKWQSIDKRIEQSNKNVATKLGVISPLLVAKWNSLNDAQKQYLINNEDIFDLMTSFTISTDRREVAAFFRLDPELAHKSFNNLEKLIEDAGNLEREYPDA